MKKAPKKDSRKTRIVRLVRVVRLANGLLAFASCSTQKVIALLKGCLLTEGSGLRKARFRLAKYSKVSGSQNIIIDGGPNCHPRYHEAVEGDKFALG